MVPPLLDRRWGQSSRPRSAVRSWCRLCWTGEGVSHLSPGALSVHGAASAGQGRGLVISAQERCPFMVPPLLDRRWGQSSRPRSAVRSWCRLCWTGEEVSHLGPGALSVHGAASAGQGRGLVISAQERCPFVVPPLLDRGGGKSSRPRSAVRSWCRLCWTGEGLVISAQELCPFMVPPLLDRRWGQSSRPRSAVRSWCRLCWTGEGVSHLSPGALSVHGAASAGQVRG